MTEGLAPGRRPLVIAWGVGACLVQLVVPFFGAPFGAVVGIVGMWLARTELAGIARGELEPAFRGRVLFGLTLSAIGAAVGVIQVVLFFLGLLFFTNQALAFVGSAFAWLPTTGCAPPIL